MKTNYNVKTWFNPVVDISKSPTNPYILKVFMACQCDQVWKELKMSDGTPWGSIHDIFCSNTQLGIYVEERLYEMIKRTKDETLSITRKRYGTRWIEDVVPCPTYARLDNEDEIPIRKYL